MQISLIRTTIRVNPIICLLKRGWPCVIVIFFHCFKLFYNFFVINLIKRQLDIKNCRLEKWDFQVCTHKVICACIMSWSIKISRFEIRHTFVRWLMAVGWWLVYQILQKFHEMFSCFKQSLWNRCMLYLCL